MAAGTQASTAAEEKKVTEGAAEAPKIQFRDVAKSFGKHRALKGVSFDLKANEVLGLVGDNGAGKSTLLHSAAGILPINDGEIRYSTGTVITPEEAPNVQGNEVGMVHQDMALVNIRPIYENIFMGRPLKRSFLGGRIKRIDRRAMRDESERILDRLGFDLLVDKDVSQLSGGEQQILAFARAIYSNPDILILDEPFTALSEDIINKMVDTIEDLKKDHSILLVSHNLDMIREMCDRVIVMRRGNKAETLSGDDIEREDILRLMIG
jgi:simple sugar transport system ATP-binding protein